MKYKPNCRTTGIGSINLNNTNEAMNKILNLFDIPFWPQLPKESFNENMYAQFSEKMPGFSIKDEKVIVDTLDNIEKEYESIFMDFINNDLEKYKISPEFSKGLYALEKEKLDEFPAIKGQMTGPLSMGLQICDKDRKPILYNDQLMDVLIKVLILKVKWQINFLKKLNKNVIVSLDEPFLSSFGSAYVSLSKEQLIDYLNQVFDNMDCIKGIHCCANTNFGIIMGETKTELISFDAFDYIDNFLLYSQQAKTFLERGGILAFGLVPSNEEAIKNETLESLMERFDSIIKTLVERGIDKEQLLSQILITSSCGTGSLSIETNELIMKITNQLSRRIREKYNLK